jgi:hypothetical protein
MSGQVLNELKAPQPARWRWTFAVVGLGIVLIAIFVAAARRKSSVEETVTLPHHSNQRPTTGTPVATVVPLPPGDRDLELVGDRIAEAAVFLRARQHGPALRALNAAAAATRELRDTRHDLDPNILSSALTEFAVIEHEIQHGEIEDARNRLLQVGRTLDVANGMQ